MADWHSYIGLPHAFGVDPDGGQGADCVLMAMRVLQQMQLPCPAFDASWFELAQQQRWPELLAIWQVITDPLEGPAEGAVTLIQNGPLGLGVGIVVDDGLLMVHHRKGVTWLPVRLLKALDYRRAKS